MGKLQAIGGMPMAINRSTDTDTPSSLQQLASDILLLVREELELAKTELAEKAKSAGLGAGMLSASALTGTLTLGCLTVLIIVALASVLPLWGAVFIATILWAAITASLALLGKKKVEDATPFVPEQTIENVKEDIARARARVNRRED